MSDSATPTPKRRAKAAASAAPSDAPTQAGETLASSPPPPPPPPAAARHVSPRTLRVALGISVALNLLVAGLVLGSVSKMGGRDMRGEMTRDLAFGPFTEALEPKDRQALRSYLQDRAPELRSANAQRRRDVAAVQAALRAQPFDAAAFSAAMAQMRSRLEGQLGLGFDGLTEVVIQMPSAERLALASRLDRGLRRGGPDGSGPEGHGPDGHSPDVEGQKDGKKHD